MLQSKKIDRYNDDFYLNQDAPTLSKRIVTTNKFPEISSGTDWSMSFFLINGNNNTDNTIIYTAVRPNDKGFSISIISGNLAFLRYPGTGGSIGHSIPYSFINKITHITITYNTSTNTAKFYFNSSLIEEISNFTTFDFKFTSNATHILNAPLVNNIGDLGVRDLCTFNKELDGAEIKYIYDKGVLPSTAYSNVESYYSLNSIPSNKEEVKYIKNINTIAWDSGVLFSDKLIGDGYLEASTDSLFNYYMFGLSDSSSPVANWDWSVNMNYGIYVTPAFVNYWSILNGGAVQETAPKSMGDILKIERIGSVITLYINNVALKTYTGVNTGTLSPILVTYGTSISASLINNTDPFTVRDVNLNGVLITDVDDSANIIGAELGMKNTADIYNPLVNTANTGLKFVGWSSVELGIPLNTTATAYKDWHSKSQFIPSFGYYTGLNVLTTQSLTINGLTIGDTLIVNYDYLGVTLQDIIIVNVVNYTYSNVNNVKIRLLSVIKDGVWVNEKGYKTVFNNGILRTAIDAFYSERVDSESDLKSPFDDLGVLKFPDVSANSHDIIANGYADLTDLQNSID